MNSIFFWISVFLIRFIEGLYQGMGIGMGPIVQLWESLLIPLGIVFWLHRDMRLRRYHPAFDSRTFLFVAWPLVGPYYLFRTRGRMAIVPIAGFVALLVAGGVLGFFLGRIAVAA